MPRFRKFSLPAVFGQTFFLSWNGLRIVQARGPRCLNTSMQKHNCHRPTSPLDSSGLCPSCSGPPQQVSERYPPRAQGRMKDKIQKPRQGTTTERAAEASMETHSRRPRAIQVDIARTKRTARTFAIKPRKGRTNSQPNLQTPQQLQMDRTTGQWQGAMGTD